MLFKAQFIHHRRIYILYTYHRSLPGWILYRTRTRVRYKIYPRGRLSPEGDISRIARRARRARVQYEIQPRGRGWYGIYPLAWTFWNNGISKYLKWEKWQFKQIFKNFNKLNEFTTTIKHFAAAGLSPSFFILGTANNLKLFNNWNEWIWNKDQ